MPHAPVRNAPSAQGSALPAAVAEGIRRKIQDGLPPNTARAYRQGWNRWAAFARASGLNAMPASPEAVAAFASAAADSGVALATIRCTLAAILKAHQVAEAPNPCGAEIVRAVVRGIAAKAPAQRQAAAITAEALAAIEAHAGMRRGRETAAQAANRARLDIALVRTMRDGLMRIGEAAALQWGSIEFAPDFSCATATFKRFKTGGDSTAYLSQLTVAALLAIRPEGADADAKVFGLSAVQLQRRFKQAAKAAGIEGASSHGARVGMAQDLAASGTELPALMQAGGWKNAGMVARYVGRQAAKRGAVARYYRA